VCVSNETSRSTHDGFFASEDGRNARRLEIRASSAKEWRSKFGVPAWEVDTWWVPTKLSRCTSALAAQKVLLLVFAPIKSTPQIGERTNLAWADERAGFYYVVVDAMLKTGFTPDEIGKIGGGNFLRVFGEAVGK